MSDGAPHRPHYEAAWKALQEAHDACFNHPDRDVLGLSSGPFSGVNETLRIVQKLETDLATEQRAHVATHEYCTRLEAANKRLEKELDDRTGAANVRMFDLTAEVERLKDYKRLYYKEIQMPMPDEETP